MASLAALPNSCRSSAFRYNRHCIITYWLMWKKSVSSSQHCFPDVMRRCNISAFSSHSNKRSQCFFSRDCFAGAKRSLTYFFGTRPKLNNVVYSSPASGSANWTDGLTSITTTTSAICTATKSRSAVSMSPPASLVVNSALGAALRRRNSCAATASSADSDYGSARAVKHYAVLAASPSPADATNGAATGPENNGVPTRLHRVCIVGAGPAGFYCAKYLLQAAAGMTHSGMRRQSSKLKVDDLKNKVTSLRVDMIEKLPAPYGLVRYGVAPDHPEIKRVADDFDVVAQNPSFRYFGNVELGKDVSLQELRSLYDAVIVAYGAAVPVGIHVLPDLGDRQLKLEGNDKLIGCLSARSFVGYYNAHPDVAPTAEARLPRLSEESDGLHPPVALVIGGKCLAGLDKLDSEDSARNCDSDVARMLTKHRKKLESTDVYGPALTWIGRANVRLVIILGRRGWVQASFTNKELRELVTDDDLLTVVDPEEFTNSLTDASRQELSESRVKQRSAPLLEQMVKNWERRNDVDCPVIHFRFLASPIRSFPHPEDPSRLGAVQVARNELKGQPFHQQAVRAQQSNVEHIACSLLIWSTGFQCVHPHTVELPTGKDGAFKNTFGRVESYSVRKDGRCFAGIYASGWARRGPHGVIASNIMDAREVAAAVLKNLEERVGDADFSPTRLKEGEAAETGRDPNMETDAAVSSKTDTVTSSATHARPTCHEGISEEVGVAGSKEACSGAGDYRPRNTWETEDRAFSAHYSATEGSRLAAAAAIEPHVLRTHAAGGSAEKSESNCFRPACEDIATLLRRRGVQFITFDDWIYIKSVEQAKGHEEGKTAAKIASAGEMLRIAKERLPASTGVSISHTP